MEIKDKSITPNGGKTNFIKAKKITHIVQTLIMVMYTCSFCHMNDHTSSRVSH